MNGSIEHIYLTILMYRLNVIGESNLIRIFNNTFFLTFYDLLFYSKITIY